MKISLLALLMLLNVSSFLAQTTSPQYKVQLSDTLFFDFGKYELTPTAQASLEALRPHLAKAQKILLVGHTDSIGTLQDNMILSQNRNQSIQSWLVLQGFSEANIMSDYYGEQVPAQDNGSPSGRQSNRRVELFLLTEKITQAPPPTILPNPKSEPEVAKSELRIQAIDKGTGEPIAAQISYEYGGKERTVQSKANEAVVLSLLLEKPLEVYARAVAEGYFHNDATILVTANDSPRLLIPLQKIEIGQKLILKNLYFVGNQATLLEESKPELNNLLEMLQLNPEVIVEIGGHINYPNVAPRDVDEWSEKLSWKRAEVVRDFLIENGIAAKRLTFKGYSNTQMLYPRAISEAHQAANRRVEIKVIGRFTQERD